VTLEGKDDVPYWDLLKRLKVFTPDVLILYSQGFIPDDPAIRNQLGESELVCGTHPAFIPTSVSGEEREAAQEYLKFLVSHCESTTGGQPAIAQQEQQTEQDDPHRPICTTPRCEKTKSFLKSHYCGESPFGNGPGDGCAIRVEKKRVPSTKLTVSYICTWNDTDGTSKCEQRGLPSPEDRSILIREMRRVGLPAQGEKEVHFTVLKSSLGWSLMAANYGLTSGTDLIVVLTDWKMNANPLIRIRYGEIEPT